MIFISKLNRSIVFSICFMFIFNISSTVYASHKVVKEERIVGVGTLVSAGLYALAKYEVVAVLCAVGLRLGMDMNNTTQTALDKFISDNPDLINSENFGKSENGLIAVSKNAIDKFTTFLKDMFKENLQDTFGDSKIIKVTLENASTLWGYKIGPFSADVRIGAFPSSNPASYTLEKGRYLILNGSMEGYASNRLKANIYLPDGRYFSTSYYFDNYGNGGNVIVPNAYDYGTYVPSNELKDDKNNIYTGNGDFILNPSWDVGANKGVLEGLPSLPWEDKTFGSIGSIGVLNPDGTITDSPSIPDVENPDIPNTDTDTNTGILGWLSKFWENLWNFFMELVKALFYPTSAISAWENLKNTINNNFKFISQLNSIKWSTNNNQRLKIPFSYAKTTTYITIPDFIEDNYVHVFRNLFKYFIYALTLFVCVQILRPKLSVGTR